jgi:adenylate kinase
MTRRLSSVPSLPDPGATASDDPPLVVLIGPPGSGKGTQCDRLAEQVGVARVSVGDALRAAVSERSLLGKQVRRFVESGQLVPDDLVIAVVAEQMDRLDDPSGVLLDGFPRTVAQADALEDLRPGAVRLAIEFVVPTLTVLRRLALRGRTDDRPDVLRARLASYERDTRPLLAWYETRGMLQLVDGNRRPAAVMFALIDLIEGVGATAAPALEYC